MEKKELEEKLNQQKKHYDKVCRSLFVRINLLKESLDDWLKSRKK